MESDRLRTIAREIDVLRTNFTNCKAYFPHMPEKLIGSKHLKTAPFYRNKGFSITLAFSWPLTQEDIRKNNEISRWINENVIVRLCAILESWGILSETICIDQSIDGWKEVDLVRRLRNVMAHTSGRYNPSNTDHKRLLEELVLFTNGGRS